MIGQNVVRDGLQLLAVAAAAVVTRKGDTVGTLHKRAVRIQAMQRQQVLHQGLGGQLQTSFTRQIAIGDAGLFHRDHVAVLGQIGKGQVCENGILRQILAGGGQHVLGIVGVAVGIGGVVAVGAQGGEAVAVLRFFHCGVGNVHQIAHDVLLGILVLASLVADDVEVQLGDDAIRGFAFKNKGVVFGLAGGRRPHHFILCGERFHLSFLREGGGASQQDHDQQDRDNLFHCDNLHAFLSFVWNPLIGYRIVLCRPAAGRQGGLEAGEVLLVRVGQRPVEVFQHLSRIGHPG